MSFSGGMVSLVNRAIALEAKGHSVAKMFIKQDHRIRGTVSATNAISIVCDILRVPAPVGNDPESVKARNAILADVGFEVRKDLEDPTLDVVRYGPFLKAFRDGLEKSPLIATNPYVKSEADNFMDSPKKAKKSDLTIKEILKVMDENLPKYYKSTTEAFLRMKPPGGVLKIQDFARFMRSINLDLPEDKLRTLFDVYDKNGNGGLDAWEFIEAFGPSICGHVDTSTSLFMPARNKPKQSRQLLEIPLDAEQTRDIILARLPLHYKSSTKAFLAAKGGVNPRSNTIDFKDLKVWLQNLNIIVPDQTIRDLFKYLDEDGSGDISAKEFIKAFGRAISGEKAENINDSEHLSFHNTRPDKRLTLLPPKHKWSFDEVKTILSERMGLIHTSSTKAFMKAKKCTSRFMSVADLKQMLANLNIEPEDAVILKLYEEIDKDGNGYVSLDPHPTKRSTRMETLTQVKSNLQRATHRGSPRHDSMVSQVDCAEFVDKFGKDINGAAGSFESKPSWFHKEMEALDAQLKAISSKEAVDAKPQVQVTKPEVRDDASHQTVSKRSKQPSLTPSQELVYKKKFGSVPSLAGSAGPTPGHHGSAGAQRSIATEMRSEPEDEGADESLPQTEGAVEVHEVPIPRNNIMPFYTQHPSSTPTRPSTAGASRKMGLYSDDELIHELRERQMVQQRLQQATSDQRRRERPRSAPLTRQPPMASPMASPEAEMMSPDSFGQGPHSKSTVATKLNRAKQLAAVYAMQESRRKGPGSRERTRSTNRLRAGQNESDYWNPPTVVHDGVFRVSLK